MKQNLYEKLAAVLGQEKVLAEEPMKKHTTFRVGGPADLFVMPSSEEEVKAAAAICDEEKVPYYIVGNGSNLLVSDKGYRGVIIQLYKEMSRIRVEDNVIYAQAGASLAKIANTALESSLTGFEFAAGIPGTIGGACVMNAGAYGGEMKDVLLEVRVMTSDGEVIVLPKEKLELGYRTSVIAKEGYIVLEAAIELRPGEQETIRTYM